MYLSLPRSLFLQTPQVAILCPFISTCRIPFSIPFRASLLVRISFSFCLSGNVLISPSYLKDSFAGYKVLGWQCFSVSTLNIPAHCFLTSRILMKNLLILLRIPCVLSHFFMLLSKFSLSLSSRSLIIMCLSVNLFELILP